MTEPTTPPVLHTVQDMPDLRELATGSTTFIPVPASQLATPGRRLGGALLSGVLVVFTLVLGYLIWAPIAWSKGTTPAKQVLGMSVIDANTGATATFGQMFMRQVVWSLVLAFGAAISFSILNAVDGFMVFSGKRQRLLDRMAGTLVIKNL